MGGRSAVEAAAGGEFCCCCDDEAAVSAAGTAILGCAVRGGWRSCVGDRTHTSDRALAVVCVRIGPYPIPPADAFNERCSFGPSFNFGLALTPIALIDRG